jgi:glycosyltransferase involved in cell wall biosynthesis
MDSSLKTCVLVTPVWDDSVRLARFGPQLAEALATSGLRVHWVVADDGSSRIEQDALVGLVREFSKSYASIELQLNSQRQYKGGAIYHAWDQSTEFDYLAFVDADGAIEAQTVIKLLKQAMEQTHPAALVGIRQHTLDAPVRRNWRRTLVSKVFQILVGFLSCVHIRDTQCGIKCIPADDYQSIASTLRERGFVFDLELLTALQVRGYSINTVAISWAEVAGGKIDAWKDMWPMLSAMFRIRNRLHAGDYGDGSK